MRSLIKPPLSLCVFFLLSACASHPPLYQWEKYSLQVYEYLEERPKQPAEQIDILVLGLQKMESKGHLPPPGYHAHLGLLYGQTGQTALMVEHFETEKKLFPESSTYMNFLLKQKPS